MGLGPGPVPEPPHVAVFVREEAVRVVAAVLVVAEAAAEDLGRLAPRARAAEAAHHLLLSAHVARAGAAHRARRGAAAATSGHRPAGRRRTRAETELSFGKTETEIGRDEQRDIQRPERERRDERRGDAAVRNLESPRAKRSEQVRGQGQTEGGGGGREGGGWRSGGSGERREGGGSGRPSPGAGWGATPRSCEGGAALRAVGGGAVPVGAAPNGPAFPGFAQRVLDAQRDNACPGRQGGNRSMDSPSCLSTTWCE